jgi:hypothetical protein
VISFNIISTVAGSPIRQPADPVTTLTTEHTSLERGTTVGLAMLGGGATYTTVLVS